MHIMAKRYTIVLYNVSILLLIANLTVRLLMKPKSSSFVGIRLIIHQRKRFTSLCGQLNQHTAMIPQLIH